MNNRKRFSASSLYKIVFSRLPLIFFWIKAPYTQIHAWEKPEPGFWPAAKRERSVAIRVVDCGSSNAAEQEILAMFNPTYDAERMGFHLVASPRHADLLLITGPITRNMQAALLAAFRAMPEPRRIITVGDDLGEESLFNSSYAIVPLPEEITAARIAHIPGDPPSPEQLLQTLTKYV